MNLNIRNILFILILISSSTLIFAQQIDQSGTLLDTIQIASEPDYPPYCFVDENGKAAGFSIDLFNAAAAAAGLKVNIKIGVWNQIKQDLAEGRLDALPLVGRTPEREEFYDFTMPYLSLHGAVFVRKETKDIHSLADLKSKSIVVMKGDNAEEFVRREHISNKIITTNTFEEAFIALAQGQHDAIITQRIMGLNLLEELKIENVIALDFQIPEFRQDFCFAVQKGNTKLLSRLNEGLSIIIANNTYEKIRLKWFGPAETVKIDYWEIALTSLYIIVPLLIILTLFFIYYLRRQVRERTESLTAEIKQHKQTYQELEKQQSLLKENEEQIRLLLNSTAEGIYGIDLNGRCTFINQSALKILGYQNTEMLLGKNMHNLIHHSRADGTRLDVEACKIYQTFRKGKGTYCDDEVLWRSDGTYFYAEYFSHPIFKDGKITGAVITFLDITERKKAEQELHRLKNELELTVAERTKELEEKVEKLNKSEKALLYMVEDLNSLTAELKEEQHKLLLSNKELEAFSYSVSHDLRAPLRHINGYVDLLNKKFYDNLPEKAQYYLTAVKNAVNQMGTLIDELLQYSRVGRQEVRKTKIEMKALVNEVVDEIKQDTGKREINWDVQKLPQVFGDYPLLKQVWVNLIDNAVKFTSKSNKAKISIGCKEEEKNFVFYVRDNGIGFDMKYAHKLFGVFQRLHSQAEFEGTGIGLANVQRIILKHNGRVWAEAEPGKGATFFFSLPKYKGELL